MKSLKVTGGRLGGYKVTIGPADFGGVELTITGSSQSNHDRIHLNLTPAEAEMLSADLAEFARMERENEKSRRLTTLVNGEAEL